MADEAYGADLMDRLDGDGKEEIEISFGRSGLN
jgi:hypothetical protein